MVATDRLRPRLLMSSSSSSTHHTTLSNIFRKSMDASTKWTRKIGVAVTPKLSHCCSPLSSRVHQICWPTHYVRLRAPPSNAYSSSVATTLAKARALNINMDQANSGKLTSLYFHAWPKVFLLIYHYSSTMISQKLQQSCACKLIILLTYYTRLSMLLA